MRSCPTSRRSGPPRPTARPSPSRCARASSWQDGSPFTSADVKASIARILDQATGAVARSNLLAIAGVDTPDDSTVVLHLSAPSAALLYSLASVNSSIESAKDISAGTVGKKPDGTGPFAWKQWDQGQQVVLTANTKYFDGAPKAETLEFRVIPDESSILSGMKAGAFQLGLISDPGVARQAGLGQQLPPGQAAGARVPRADAQRPDAGRCATSRYAQAISCAVDRNQVLQTAAYGDGTVTGPITSPGLQLLGHRWAAVHAGRRHQGQVDACRSGPTEAASRSTRSSRPASTRRRSPKRRTSSRSWPRSA